MRRAGHVADILGCSIVLADLSLTQGRLDEAGATYERALRLADDHTGAVLPGTADMLVGLAQVAVERHDLDAAMAHLLRSRELGELAALPQTPYRWRVAMAHVTAPRSDVPAALTLLGEALALYAGDFSPDVRPVAAVRARMLLTHGHIDRAFAWADEVGVSSSDDLSYLYEYEHVTLAHVLLARHAASGEVGSLRAAGALLQRLLVAAEAGGRTGTVIEVLVLEALARQADGDTPAASVQLRRVRRRPRRLAAGEHPSGGTGLAESGRFGPEASIYALALIGLVAALTIRAARHRPADRGRARTWHGR